MPISSAIRASSFNPSVTSKPVELLGFLHTHLPQNSKGLTGQDLISCYFELSTGHAQPTNRVEKWIWDNMLSVAAGIKANTDKDFLRNLVSDIGHDNAFLLLSRSYQLACQSSSKTRVYFKAALENLQKGAPQTCQVERLAKSSFNQTRLNAAFVRQINHSAALTTYLHVLKIIVGLGVVVGSAIAAQRYLSSAEDSALQNPIPSSVSLDETGLTASLPFSLSSLYSITSSNSLVTPPYTEEPSNPSSNLEDTSQNTIGSLYSIFPKGNGKCYFSSSTNVQKEAKTANPLVAMISAIVFTLLAAASCSYCCRKKESSFVISIDLAQPTASAVGTVAKKSATGDETGATNAFSLTRLPHVARKSLS